MQALRSLTKTEKYYLFLILALSFSIKIVLALTVHVELRSDSMVYDALAKNIVNLGEYSFEGRPTALLIPGYPIFLSIIYFIFGSGQLIVKIIQSSLDILTCFLVFSQMPYAL